MKYVITLLLITAATVLGAQSVKFTVNKIDDRPAKMFVFLSQAGIVITDTYAKQAGSEDAVRFFPITEGEFGEEMFTTNDPRNGQIIWTFNIQNLEITVIDPETGEYHILGVVDSSN